MVNPDPLWPSPKRLIVVGERQAPMRRVLRRLLGKHPFEWKDSEEGTEILRLASRPSLGLIVLEDHLPHFLPEVALPQLRSQGCTAPIVLLVNRFVPSAKLAQLQPLVIIDRCDVAARFAAVALELLQ